MGLMTRKPVPDMTYNVFGGTLNLTPLHLHRHIGFDLKWILTILWPLKTHTAPTHKISAKLDNARLSHGNSSIWLGPFFRKPPPGILSQS